ncbi:N-acetylglucosamine repressor [Salmonella enterica subsp. enterica]|uniref:N-acetylglucosamine repressor n=1 Tax=Salmonella enterica I TaxID=59201 RepID=A0A379WY56_SALET|nr:N-acetylglucosamine repressor [Salmonella enterica subsp. enterica]
MAFAWARHDTTLTLYDLSSKVVAEEHYPLPERTQETLEHALLNTIAVFIDSCQRKIRELIAISVILPGLVDPESGVIRYMPHIQVENWGLVEALEKRFHVTCFVGHDIRSLALAEHYFGASQDCEDSILVRVIVVQAPGLSPTDASSLAVTATSAKLGIFRWSRWASAATAVISAVWKPLPPMRRLNNGC